MDTDNRFRQEIESCIREQHRVNTQWDILTGICVGLSVLFIVVMLAITLTNSRVENQQPAYRLPTNTAHQGK